MNENARIDLGSVFDAHMAAEFEQHDADATMETMTAEPYLTHVPVVTGGVGHRDLHDFYRDHFVTKWPADLSVERITRTQGDDILIDEFIVRYTHDVVMDAILPRFIEMSVFQAILESKASQWSAQMVAMRNATDAAGDLIDDLTLAANKARQSRITKEMLEIASGAEALGKG